MEYLVDTNALFHIIKICIDDPNNAKLDFLKDAAGCISFFVPEIVVMEIMSVIGKHIRGKSEQKNVCNRAIHGSGICQKTWTVPANKMNKKKANAFKKSCEIQFEKFKMTIISIKPETIQRATELLEKHAPIRNFRSLDAVVAGSVEDKLTTTVITNDKILFKVLELEGIQHQQLV